MQEFQNFKKSGNSLGFSHLFSDEIATRPVVSIPKKLVAKIETTIK